MGSSSQSPSRHHAIFTNSKQIGLEISAVSDHNAVKSNANVQHVIQSRSGIGMLDEIQIATTSRQSPNSSQNIGQANSNIIRSGSDITPWRNTGVGGAGAAGGATTAKREAGTSIN